MFVGFVTNIRYAQNLDFTKLRPHIIQTSQNLDLTKFRFHKIKTAKNLNFTKFRPHKIQTSQNLDLKVAVSANPGGAPVLANSIVAQRGLFKKLIFRKLKKEKLHTEEEHASREKKLSVDLFFYFRAQKCIQNWIPRDLNPPMRGV